VKKFRSTAANTSLSNKKIKAEICACLCVRACAFYYRNKRIINPFLMAPVANRTLLCGGAPVIATPETFPQQLLILRAALGAQRSAHTKQTHRWKIFSLPHVFSSRAPPLLPFVLNFKSN
jgi:hypothetical protein